jgi:hypothetical protein
MREDVKKKLFPIPLRGDDVVRLASSPISAAWGRL